MKKFNLILVAAVLCILGLCNKATANEIVWQDIGRGNLNLNAVLVNPDNYRVIYIGSSNGVLRTEDGGEAWRNVLSVKGQNARVNFLLFDSQDKNSLYAATGGGLFYSSNQGKNWKRIFHGKNYLENECTGLVSLPYGIILGTKVGLFLSKDKGRSWSKEKGELGKNNILAIACDLKEPAYIYIACTTGVFSRKDSAQSWQKIFLANTTEEVNDSEDKLDDYDDEERTSNIKYITIDPNNSGHLFLATSKGVYKSQDRGMSWQPLSDYGLLSSSVKFLLVSSDSSLYAISQSGIFEYKYERWQGLSLSLAVEQINYLTSDKQGNLYAACDKGLFKTESVSNNYNLGSTYASLYCKDEPAITEVQKAAVKYAEVEPEKIKQWRKQARQKAWLPKVSVGIDRDASDLWHWESGSTTKNEDDVLRKGRDALGWNVNLSWDLSEVIWNNDQTSIDVRSRLSAQLRDEILDEVTKLYFERLRVKMEMDSLSIEDRKKRFKKELKLKELTAYLDAVTGGFFSNYASHQKISCK